MRRTYETHPRYKLIVAANRDEFLNRPTAKADFWEDEPDLYTLDDAKEVYV